MRREGGEAAVRLVAEAVAYAPMPSSNEPEAIGKQR